MTNTLRTVLVAVLVLASGVIAEAQQPAKLFRIGYISSADPATESARAEAVRMALRERGYIEGQNIAIVYRYTEQKDDRGRDVLAELVGLKVDIILVAGGPSWVQLAKNATKSIPIVMVGIPVDPVETGLIDSLARPGGNVTGNSLLTRELGGKRLELLKEAISKLVHVAVLYDPSNRPSVLDVKEVLPIVAKALKLTLHPLAVRSADDLDKVFTAIVKQRPDGLYVTSDAVLRINQKTIVDFSLKNRLPSMYYDRIFVDAGGLMSYGADTAESYRRVAYYVDRILKGTKPAELPVEQPMRFELVVNLKTAKQIGVTIDPNLLARATRLIK